VYNGAGVQSTVAVLVWSQTRGVGSLHRAPPRALALEEEQMRSEVDPRWRFLLVLQVPPLWRLRTLPAAHPGCPAASKQVSFSDPLVFPQLHQERPRLHPGTIFFLLPRREVFARPRSAAPQPPQRRYLQHQRKPPMRIDL
jgi:hypothetical protein